MALNYLNWCLEYYEENIDECNSILNSLDDFDKIPLLDSVSLQTFTDGTLIRYRGMIQDMLNPEYYSCSFNVLNKENNETYIRSGKYRDIAACKPNEELSMKEVDFMPKERLVYFCVPLPGTNDWVHNLQKNHMPMVQNYQISSCFKRCASDMDAETEFDISQSASFSNLKRNKTSTSTAGDNSRNYNYDNDKYFPIPYESGMPCIVKVYEEEEKFEFILNDAVEIIGFLSLNPALDAKWDNTNSEDKAFHPPPSLVPRIHSLRMKKLRHNNPLLKQIISHDNIAQFAENVRSDLHLVLTQLLFEDTLAAEYVICHLISKIYIRNDCNTIGKFSLNLFNIGLKSFAECFYNILKTMVTNSHFVSLSTNLLNEKSFVPRKDYESNKLWSGLLQLCEDFHLILDETNMNEGQLNNTGCLNVAALQRLCREQEVEYDFGYYPVKYNTNIPVLVISDGKSMFQTDIRLKVKSELCTEANFNESVQAVRLYLNEEVLNKIRIYLTSIRLQEFELCEEMVRRIGEDYVSLRQRDRKVSSSDLHTLLILSRLLALSHGRFSLDLQDWNQAVEMETERKSKFT